MHCPTCAADYRLRSSAEGKTRNTCACDRKKQRCAFKKRGSGCGEVVQGEVDEGETHRFRCEEHAIEATLDTNVAIRPTGRVAEPKDEEPENPDSRVGMVIEEHTYIGRKKQAQEHIKTHVYKVKCRNQACASVHQYSSRKLMASEDTKTWPIVCPKCGETGYTILE